MNKSFFSTLLGLFIATLSLNAQSVEKWDCFEISFAGPSSGNPYVEVTLDATFSKGSTSITVPGFYDGNGIYKIRFMPHSEGVWSYVTSSSASVLNGQTGSFTCVPPTGNNRGPVGVRDTFHFQYEDGTPYFENGTTVYGWINQTTALQDLTLQTLSQHRFNKLRICIFPKSFDYGNDVEPEHYPVEGTLENWDFTRFNPNFWHNLEMRLDQLQDLGIEADIIVMHPYDSHNGLTFGFKNNQTQEELERYWAYMIARLSCYRNVWWSMANEYHLVGLGDDFWDDMGIFFQNNDPYDHLRSIHNYPGNVFNQNQPWITHVSYQGNPVEVKDGALQLRNKYQKPIVYDEARYEGDVASSWGRLTGEEMTQRYWEGTVRGVYMGHGECYLSPDNILWWSRGGSLKGTSPARIDWFDTLMNHIPEKKLEPVSGNDLAGQKGDDYFLYYYSDETATSRSYSMPANIDYRVSLLDTWNMTITDMGVQSGDFSISMPNDPYLAVQMYKAGTEPTSPTFVIDSFTTTKAYSGNAYTGSIADRAFDPNGDTVSYLKTSGPGWLSVAADGTLSGTPSNADIGSNIFSVEVSNTNGESDIATMTILVVSASESLIQSDDFESGFGNWASGGARCIRVENNDGSYRIRVIQKGNDSTLSSTHDLPLDGYTEVTVEYTFSLANLESGEGHTLEMSTNSGASWTRVHKIGRGKSTSDDPRNWITYVDERVTITDYILTNQTRFRFSGNANGAAKEFSTLDDIRIYASGSINGGPTPPNSPPVFNVDPINGSNASEDLAYSDTIASSVTDPDGNTLTYSKSGRDSGPGTDWLVIAADGTLAGTPSSSEVGTHSWTVEVDDGNGGMDTATLSIVVNPVSQIIVIADFVDDFPESSGDGFQNNEGEKIVGWDYLWNPGGVLADAANYVSLSPNTIETSRDFWDEGIFTSNGSLAFNDVGQGDFRWGRVGTNTNGLHPGGGETGDFRAIAAYTLQDGEAGTVSITNSFVERGNFGGQVALDIYVNDTFKWSVISVGDYVDFDGDLGELEIGDTVYVMLGKGNDGFVKDASALDFTLESTTGQSSFTAPEVLLGPNTSVGFSQLTPSADGYLVFSYVRHGDESKYDHIVLTSDNLIEWNDIGDIDTLHRPVHLITESFNDEYDVHHLFFTSESESFFVKVQVVEFASF
ncbi:MAG: DUF5060 domain-containing protein [Verrucomicrobiota bacterium]